MKISWLKICHRRCMSVNLVRRFWLLSWSWLEPDVWWHAVGASKSCAGLILVFLSVLDWWWKIRLSVVVASWTCCSLIDACCFPIACCGRNVFTYRLWPCLHWNLLGCGGDVCLVARSLHFDWASDLTWDSFAASCSFSNFRSCTCALSDSNWDLSFSFSDSSFSFLDSSLVFTSVLSLRFCSSCAFVLSLVSNCSLSCLFSFLTSWYFD